jgi:hypothetical protein
MNKNKIASLIFALSLIQMTEYVSAEPAVGKANFCTKRSGAISPGRVAPRQEAVIFGPYSVKCGTTSHHFQVRGASGQLPVKVQRMVNGGWTSVTSSTYDPSGNYGSGTFRLVLDNRQNAGSASYKGSFTVPM